MMGTNANLVSPITIRLRILKVHQSLGSHRLRRRFTHHDPLEDTESPLSSATATTMTGFTHHDPLEDTESAPAN